MTSALDQLRKMTVVVADTGDIEAVRRLAPVDCTTNPSLVLKAMQSPASEGMVAHEIEAGRRAGRDAAAVADALTLRLGTELAGIVPGRVSTEVDARLSFDADASAAKAREIIAGYEALGIGRERILIKLASTWEGLRAAERLQGEGIDCNMTLIFSLAQAVAAAAVGAFLISPFVGRITDWYSKAEGRSFGPEEDPGVLSVRGIYNYYKSNGIATVVMGASFRSAAQIKALAGCDQLTISPALMEELGADRAPLARVLSAESATGAEPVTMDEAGFRWAMNADRMASDKLAEGIRGFDTDHQTLIGMVAARMQ
jgi:transaldolase